MSLPNNADAAHLASGIDEYLSYDAIFGPHPLGLPPAVNLRWHPTAQQVTYLKPDGAGGHELVRYDIATDSHFTVIPADDAPDGLAISSYEWFPDGERLLVAATPTRTWDGQLEAAHYLLDLAARRLQPLSAAGRPLRNVFLSPDGTHVGYAYGNNLYIAPTDSAAAPTPEPPREIAVTTTGSQNIVNAVFDYGSSEFGVSQPWMWSPDGSRLAFLSFDVTDVPTWAMVDELGNYPIVRHLKYPNTAERHAVTSIGVYDLATRETTWMDTGRDPEVYLPQLRWARGSEALIVQRLTRNHQLLEILLADVRTGASSIIYRETDPAWVEITDSLLVSRDGESFVCTSERSGFNHVYRVWLDGAVAQLTSGEWEVSAIIGWDELSGQVYFTGKKDGFVNQHVYRVGDDGGGDPVQKLSGHDGWHEWSLSPDGAHAVVTFSSIDSPPSLHVVQPDGTLVADLELASAVPDFLPRHELLRFDTSDGVTLDAYCIKPPDFDESRQYPVIAYGYGNAGFPVVCNRWGAGERLERFLWHLRQAALGYIVFCADNRTSVGRGKAAKNLTYGHYAKYAVSDQVETAAYLRSLPYIDGDRLGFWGWSGGAYLTCALMTKEPGTFQVGVSGAPVIDLTRYQAVGVERWMGLPQDNPDGYYQVNVMNFADGLQGDLLLMHGTGDENVKYAFTLQFADSLVKAGKQFDMMIYPNEHHDVDGVKPHVYRTIERYFAQRL